MGAKLNFNTHLLNIMFDFLSYLSAGPTCSTVQKLWYSVYVNPFTVRCVCYVTLSLTPGDQNLGQITTKRLKRDTFCSCAKTRQNYHLHHHITNISIVLQLYQPLLFTLINPIWNGVLVTVR